MQTISYERPAKQAAITTSSLRAQPCPEPVLSRNETEYLDGICAHAANCIAAIPEPIIAGHYKYCHEFLWPLMHGRPDIGRYGENAHNCYRSLNVSLAAHLNWCRDTQPPLLQDHYFALLPQYLSKEKASEGIYLWRIPWPSCFPENAETQLTEIAKGMLLSKTVVFQTAEYAETFQTFIKEFLPDFKVLADGRKILHSTGHPTELLVRPAGIDYRFCYSSLGTATLLPPTCFVGGPSRLH